MILNADKTKIMLMAGKQKLKYIPHSKDCLNAQIQGSKLEQVSSERLLGVQVDNCLTWDEQVQKVRKTCLFKLSLLRKIRRYLPLNVRKMYFSYYIKPHLDYCSTIWGHTSKENISKLNKIQKQAARLILDKDYTTPSEELFRELSWLNFSENIKYQQATLVYKSLNNLAPGYMRSKFSHVQDSTRANLRSSLQNKLFIPRVHHKSIRFSGPRVWNDLSPKIREAKDVTKFKNLYIKEKLQI